MSENINVQEFKKAENKNGLIAQLENIQAKYGYLPQEQMRSLSESSGKPLVDIYGVATFYKSFSLEPRGKHIVSVCLGTACHVRGGPVIAEEFIRRLGIRPGKTTPDKEFTLETVACLGACALGPIVVVDGKYYSKVNVNKVKNIIKETKEKVADDVFVVKPDDRIFPIEVSCAHCNHSLMDTHILVDDYPSIWATISFERKHGWLRLSSLYGSENIKSDCNIPDDSVVNFFCPHCHSELRGASNCSECGAPMVSMIVRGGGVVQICTRQGCKGHMLDVSNDKY